jgi:hypothetical protein
MPKLPESTRRKQARFNKGSLFYSNCGRESSYFRMHIHLLHTTISEAGHILYLRILYPIHIQAKKRILYPIHIQAQKKDMDIYPISFVKNFASIVTVSEQQKARPGKNSFAFNIPYHFTNRMVGQF